MKTASIYTLGCRLNQSETMLIQERLELAGYSIVPFGERADLGIINTCTVTNEADAKSRKAIRSFIRANPDAYTAVIGCYAQMDPGAIGEIEGVDLIIGNQEKLNILDYVEQGRNDSPVVVRDRIESDDFVIDRPPSHGLISYRVNLKVQDGCDFMCSFCVIPFARGRARSRDFRDLVTEARALVERGAKEIVLTGINIGTYSQGDRSLVNIVDALNDVEGLLRLRISSIEPTTISDALLERMDDSAHTLVPHLHIPVQSGSDRILRRMRRRYTRKEFLDFVERADARVADLCVGTDIMVGAPGETDSDFVDTMDLFESGPMAYAHVFKYSERDGTAAARQQEQVHPDVKSRRSAVARRMSARKTTKFRERFLGKNSDVLFETSRSGFWQGYTANFIRVSVPSNDILENEIRSVRLDEVHGDTVMGSLAKESTAVA